MKVSSKIYLLLCSVVFMLSGYESSATHIFGGELLYTHISGDTYRVVMTLYGDCSSSASSALPTSEPAINIYDGSTLFTIIKLQPIDVGQEVSPVCPGQLANTTCNGGTLPGVKKFVYADTVTLPSRSERWSFIFAGDMTASSGTGVSYAGRSSAITNINNPGTSYVFLKATLNNLVEHNSSPQYSSIPTPYYCLSPDQQYNQGAIDSDGDSLSFSLVPALSGVVANPLLSGPVAYKGTFSGSNPLDALAGAFTFVDLNGQLTFTPQSTQDALVVNQVSEYRNGVLIGTSQREMTFIVSNDCEGTPPKLTVENVTGGAITGKNVINICVGTPSLSFSIDVSNPDRDTTYITPKNVPGTATLDIDNNNTPDPTISFNWNTATLSPGVYTFYLDVKNNHCPISNRQTLAYTINITPYPTVTAAPISPTNCVHQAFIKYDMAFGYLPRIVTVRDGPTVVATYVDSVGSITDSLPVGNYTVDVSSAATCATSYDFTIADGGVLPLSPVDQVYCKNDLGKAVQIETYSADAVVTWYDIQSNPLPAAPVPPTNVAASYLWLVTQKYKVCVSDTVAVKVVVNPLPGTQILTRPDEICVGDTLYLEASGGEEFNWSPVEKLNATADGRIFARITSKASFAVTSTNEFGCADADSITYDNIKPCCKFSYPTAFTPNGDGKNDGFKVVTYGNNWSYKLAIYNRWGQLVFLTYSADKYWDGTYNGKPCEVGTYYYFFEGRCLTGGTDEHQGDITLIR